MFSFELILSPIWTNVGMDSAAKQATASKQLDIFFKENVFLVSGDIRPFSRLFLAIVNSLKFMNNIGGAKTNEKIKRPTSQEKTKLTNVRCKIKSTKTNNAKSV